MKFQRLDNGNLLLIIDHDGERASLKDLTDEEKIQTRDGELEFFEGILANSEWDWIEPAFIGALTDAPILGIYGKQTPVLDDTDTDKVCLAGHWDDKSWYLPITEAYAWMNYQVQSLLEELRDKGQAELQSGLEKEEEDFDEQCACAEKHCRICHGLCDNGVRHSGDSCDACIAAAQETSCRGCGGTYGRHTIINCEGE